MKNLLLITILFISALGFANNATQETKIESTTTYQLTAPATENQEVVMKNKEKQSLRVDIIQRISNDSNHYREAMGISNESLK